MSSAPKPPSSSTPTLEFERNEERYAFLRWGQSAFRNFSRRAARHRHLPPGEPRVPRTHGLHVRGRREDARVSRHARRHRLAHHDGQRARRARLGRRRHRGRSGDARPAALDAHPRGRRLQAARAGSPPAPPPPTSCSTVTQMLRKKRVVGKFVEFYGAGLSSLALADRATIANMAPEYGATIGFFPVDDETLRYLAFTGRGGDHVAARRGVLQGAGDCSAPTTRPIRASPTRSSSISPPSSPASPARSARRTACRSRTRRRMFAEALKPELERVASRGPRAAPSPSHVAAAPCTRRRRRRDRRDHQLHEHLEPQRHDRGRPARARRPWRWASRASRG